MKIFFFFNDTATTEIYTLSLHDALPISRPQALGRRCEGRGQGHAATQRVGTADPRSEEHTSELQSQSNLVCRLLLEKNRFLHVVLNTSHTFDSLLHCFASALRTLTRITG